MAKIARYVRDRPNDFTRHSDGSQSMSAFVISDQIRNPCKQAADLIIGIARGISPQKSGDYRDSFGIGPKQAFWFKPADGPLQLRAVVEVVNTSDKAPAIEFGSGRPNEGQSPDIPREQGGSNRPFRILGRAAARVGDFHE